MLRLNNPPSGVPLTLTDITANSITSPAASLKINDDAAYGVTFFASAATGENPKISISGYDSQNTAIDTYTISAAMDSGAGTKLAIGLDETMRTIVICDAGDVDADFGLIAAIDPKLYIATATGNPGASFTHNAWIASNTGTLTIQSGQKINFNFGGVNADRDAYVFSATGSGELTDTNGEQSWLCLEPQINQSGTAVWNGIKLSATLTSEGDGTTSSLNENTLVNCEVDSVPLWNVCVEKVVKAHNSDLFNAAALTDTSDIFTLPANSILMSCVIDLDTQFAGVTTLKIELGITANDTDGFLVPGAMDLTADSAGSNYSNRGAYWNGTTAGFYYAASAKVITALATSTVEDVDQTSAGNVVFYFTYMTLPTTT